MLSIKRRWDLCHRSSVESTSMHVYRYVLDQPSIQFDRKASRPVQSNGHSPSLSHAETRPVKKNDQQNGQRQYTHEFWCLQGQ